MTLPEPVVANAATLVAARLGLAFPIRRRADLEQALLVAAGKDGPHALLARLAARPTTDPAWIDLIGRLTVQESYFFRDTALFTALRARVLPELIARQRAAHRPRLVLWSAGCAAGEEPYSLAILLAELLPDRSRWDVTILATDIDAAALAAAQRARYTEWALRETPLWMREQYFRRGPRHFELDAEIRTMVSFAPLNLAADAFPGGLDLIVCRNVLMYFTTEARRRAVTRLAHALAPEGRLAFSPLDVPLDAQDDLEPVDDAGFRLHRRHPSAPALTADVTPAAPAAAAAAISLEHARAEADRGRLEHARALCQQALRIDPLDVEAHLLLSAIEDERGEAEAAIESLRRAVYAAPDSAAAHFRLGGLLLRTGAGEPGRRSLEAAAGLLRAEPPDLPLPGSGGVTAGTLLAAARARLETSS